MASRFKRVISIVLIAVMVLGVPVVSPVSKVAKAATLSTTQSVTLSLASKNETYQTITADGLAALVGATATATVSNQDIIGIALDSDLRDSTGGVPTISELKAGTKADATQWKSYIDVAGAYTHINIKALKAGTATITLQASDSARTVQNITVTVSSVNMGIRLTDGSGNSIAEGSTLSLVEGKTITAKVTLDNMKTSVSALGNKSDTKTTGYVISDESVTTASFSSDTFTFFGTKEGTTDVALYLIEDGRVFNFHIQVLSETKLTTTIDGVTYTYDGSWWAGDTAKNPTIYLNPTDTKAAISVTSNNGNAVTYSTTSGSIVVGNTGTVEARLGTNGATTPGTYYVTATVAANQKTGQIARSADITVIVSSKKAKLVSIEVKDSAGTSLGKSSASITGPDTYARGEATGDTLKLSTRDKVTESVSLVSTVNTAEFLTVTSTNSAVVTYENGVVKAVAAGSASLVFTARPDSTSENYEAVLTIPVTVYAKMVKNVITATEMTLTEAAPSSGIAAQSTYNSKLSYPTLARVATSSDSAADQKAGYHDYQTTGAANELFDVYVNSDGIVTYKKNGKSGVIYVKITGAETTDAVAPDPVYVKVTYGDLTKKASDLKIDKNRIDITVGDAVSAGAASTQVITYASDKPEIATVSAEGLITAVAAGTAVITVSAAENQTYLAGQETITVVVAAKAPEVVTKKDNPMKATGNTVTKKYKKVSKQDVNIGRKKAYTVTGAKGIVNYAKSSGRKKITVAKNGKITIKKGMKAGTYKLKVKVTAAGDTTYNSASVTVTVTIIIK